MFGEIAPRMKGGFNRLMQAISIGYAIYKGPPDVDLQIAAGDRSIPTMPAGNQNYQGRTLVLRGGTPGDPGLYNFGANDRRADGGGVQVIGADSTGNYGLGGSVIIQAGFTNSIVAGQTAIGAAVTLQGGGHASTGSATGGAAVVIGGSANNGGVVQITGGSAIAGSGGTVTVKGGTSTSGSGGGVTIKGADGVTAGAGGAVLIQPGIGVGGLNVSNNIKLDSGNGAAVATAATGGFVTFPTCAGTPTGTPAAANVPTGSLPIVFDSTNNRLFAYINGGWRAFNGGGVVNSQSANYTTTLADGGENRVILHPSSDANARTFTIAANGSVAYDVGMTLTFVNDSANALSIAINTDTLVLEGAGTTGTRTLAQFGRAVATKISSTRWYISGTNLT